MNDLLIPVINYISTRTNLIKQNYIMCKTLLIHIIINSILYVPLFLWSTDFGGVGFLALSVNNRGHKKEVVIMLLREIVSENSNFSECKYIVMGKKTRNNLGAIIKD